MQPTLALTVLAAAGVVGCYVGGALAGPLGAVIVQAACGTAAMAALLRGA